MHHFLRIAFLVSSLSCVGPGAPPPHPYQGLVLDEPHMLLQIGQPETFLNQAFETARSWGIPQVQGRNWREAILLTIGDLEARKRATSFLDKVDTAAPVLLGITELGGEDNRRIQIVFTMKTEPSADFREFLESGETRVEVHDRIVTLTVNPSYLLEPRPLDLGVLSRWGEPALDFWMSTEVPFWPEALTGFSAVAASFRIEPTLDLRLALHSVPGSERSAQMARMGRLSQGTWDMLNKIPSADIIGGGSHLDPKPMIEMYSDFLRILGDDESIAVYEVLMEMMESMEMPEDPRTATGLSVELPPGTIFTAMDFIEALRNARWHYTSHATIDTMEQMSEMLKLLPQLQEGASMPFDFEEIFSQLPPSTREVGEREYKVWNLDKVKEILGFGFVVTQTRDGPFYVTDFSSATVEDSIQRLAPISNRGSYPFPEDTEMAVWFDIDRLAELFPRLALQEALGRVWVLVTANDRSLEMRMTVPRAVVKYFIGLVTVLQPEAQ